ncbi:pyrroline-5-carboxylate reductase [Novosphingobium chloroacetimidivorans]|uniref:Pyrroline-5-carboxylate reductase n=1 Tax=Novosphingobium chloroacetimidivorans TaxID=1428314 RepID=A0A7W7K916_9SPHN|nr:pyrroline-5-carboxylate reductase [Novosphingobium chloroacetimidivorans]
MNLDKVLIVGCGNMGGAMLQGWLAGGVAPGRITVADPRMAEAPAGVMLVREVPVADFDVVLLGVKPQLLDAVAPQVAPAIGQGTILLSILAGVELATLATRFPDAKGIVRVMPNLAAAIGRSPLALSGQGLDQAGRDAVTALLEPLGTPEWLASEDLFDAVTALAGCGPAFVYRYIDALAAGATALGVPRDQAQRLALATAEGSALLAASSEHGPGELARRVASPGGSTQAGLDVLDADQALVRLVEAAMTAAERRSAEMGRDARGG